MKRLFGVMPHYRYITPRRRGKWYANLIDAQRQASAIGAGFLDGSGSFVPYRGTILELR
ncbi:hypothetical protein [Erythrobacter sp. 3-20A1M]|uniref:hypothetical protein n=1 Tax=Erythrobacter sp. 3-20A1M TaxID=2653850 RepID=UPI001BFC4B1F|nr:hypothetical protein [Erythrobacter sp. 3-20A1M]